VVNTITTNATASTSTSTPTLSPYAQPFISSSSMYREVPVEDSDDSDFFTNTSNSNHLILARPSLVNFSKISIVNDDDKLDVTVSTNSDTIVPFELPDDRTIKPSTSSPPQPLVSTLTTPPSTSTTSQPLISSFSKSSKKNRKKKKKKV
jgi:hypothetical protein